MRERDAPAPLSFDAVIFDLDGVVTRTARVHAAAWKELFDDLLRAWTARGERPFCPFDAEADYLAYVDGRPRHEGVRAFLAARGLQLPEGNPADPPDAVTVQGLAARKDEMFIRRMRAEGVQVFSSTLALITNLRARGVRPAVVTSSRNGREVLRVAGLEELFDVRVDGIDLAVVPLRGKPHPDSFLRAAELLEVRPGRAIVVEDATSGVEAGRRGGFALVVGVDRGGNREALLASGADVVVADLGEIDVERLEACVRERRRAFLSWTIEQEGFDPAREHGLESLFTVGSGYMGVRGALDSPLPGSHADLFVAGVYDRKSDRPYSEMELIGDDRGDQAHSEIVSLPFPFRLRLAANGVLLEPTTPGCRELGRSLDLRSAVLHGYAEYHTDSDRRVVVRTRRCASLADPHLLLQEVTVTLVNHSGEVEIDTSLGDVDLEANHPHLIELDPRGPHGDAEVHRYSTRASGVEIGVASRAIAEGAERADTSWRLPARIGQSLRLVRFVAVHTNLEVDDPAAAAVASVRGLAPRDFERALQEHRGRWTEIWRRADVRIEGSPATEQALRFNAYHLMIAADPDPRTAVGARALTGRAYEGHVFWDLEMFKLPFYLHTFPELARSLIQYRYCTIDGARRRARALGYRGACYAWESSVTGDDVTPRTIRLRTTGKEIPIFTGTQQIHVTAAVAYAIWRYWEATRDRDFMRQAGVEMLVETARFWASRCTPAEGSLHIRGVVGPDEYHHSVDDNAYTNWMARFNVERAVEAVDWLRREDGVASDALRERLGLRPDEPAEWAEVARTLFCPGPDGRGVIEQFEGFFDLEDYELPRHERFRAPISRLFEWERINRSKIIKQADVLMLLHVFPSAFSSEIVRANYRYYEPMTDHASSLSPGIHAAIAARIGLCEDAVHYLRQSLWLDLSDRMGNSATGIHPACMGATWQALVFGFLGVRFEETGPVREHRDFSCLPSKWERVAVSLMWRGRAHEIRASSEELP